MQNWKLKEKVTEAFREQNPTLSGLQAQLLWNRGIVDPDTLAFFLDPKYEQLHDPFLFRDMKKAVARIWKAIDDGEQMVVYSDYDADAITAAAVLSQTFRYLHVACSNYIPDRFTEGYGLNISAFEQLKEQGVSVVITVDCGTNSVEIAEFCKENGIDLIITDHHEITGNVPDSFALINPKNPADTYPYPQITGVGVAYKLAKALLADIESVRRKVPSHIEGWDKWLLDLVAIGTVADCHSLIGENRILVACGLKVLAKTKWPGLKELLLLAGVQQIDSETLGFILAPRINAAGRLEHASLALDCLIAEDVISAKTLADRLEKTNERRKALTARILSEAREVAEKNQDRKVLVLAHASWHKGLVGIVAGKLAGEYARPVVVLEQGELEATGSVRSFGSFNTVEALKSAEDTLLRFGGHKEAAGLTLLSTKIEAFREKMLLYAENVGGEVGENRELLLETELTADEISLSSIKEISALEPFGSDNEKPVFAIRNAKPVSLRKIGKDKSHLQGKFQIGNRFVDAIGFGKGYLVDSLSLEVPLSLAVELLLDTWNGASRVKLRIVDVKL